MRKSIDADAADLLALVDELPSLFAEDEADDNSSSSIDTPCFTSAQRLSANELGELLQAIDDDSEQQQQQPQPQDVQPEQQTPQLLQMDTVTNVKLLKKRRVMPSASSCSNKLRDGRKQELMYLRKAVLEFETRLDVLKRKRKNNNMCNSNTSSSTLTALEIGPYNRSKRNRDAGGLDDVWREIARHQCSERDKSERENTRLRVVLESQLKVAKSLEKFLMLKAAASCLEIGKSVDLQRGDQLPHYSDLSGRDRDAAIFHDLLTGVGQSLAEVDAVYETNGLARVEVCASKVLPFGVHETGDAVWNHYTFAKQHMPFRYYTYHSLKSIGTTADTIMEDFSLQIHTKGTRASFRMRKVTRRVVQDDRVVIVWHRFTYPLEFSEQPVSGLRAFEKGYIVIRKSSGSSSRPNVTLLQPCHIMYPCVELEGNATAVVGEAAGNTVASAITNFRLSTTAEFVTDTHQMVENVLMEQALRKSSSGADLEPSGVSSSERGHSLISK